MDAAFLSPLIAQSAVFVVFLVVMLALLIGAAGWLYVTRYKKCPLDRLLIVYGHLGGDRAALVMHGGARFVWPVIQDFAYISLEPIAFDFAIENGFTGNETLVSVSGSAVVAVDASDPSMMNNAAERLIGVERERIAELAKEIVLGRLRDGIATQRFEEIERDPAAFEGKVREAVSREVRMLGLELRELRVDRVEGKRVEVS